MLWIALVVVALVAIVAAVVRVRRAGAEREFRANSVDAVALRSLLEPEPPRVLLYDVRQPLDLLAYSEIIPGAKRVPPKEILANPRLVPSDADVVIYAISTNISRIEGDGDKVLRYLTTETGGQAFFPFKVQDLAQDFENIANELRRQYNIFYRPEPLKADGLYHSIGVKVNGRKDLVVRARKGYYARREAVAGA